MLEKVDLSKKIGKKEFRTELEKNSERLALLQRECREAGIPVMILFEGFGAAGKGTQINRLIQPMDPRGFVVHAGGKVTEEEKYRPFLYRYWIKTPARGRIVIFERSWYRSVLTDRFDGTTREEDVENAFQDIRSFEKQLTDDGTAIIKLFLYISKEEQKKRFDALEKSEETRWRVDSEDRRRNKEYGKYLRMNEEMLEKTDSEYASWTIIEATDKDYATIKIMSVIVDALETELAKKKQKDAMKAEKKALAQKEAERNAAGGEESVEAADTAAEQSGSPAAQAVQTAAQTAQAARTARPDQAVQSAQTDQAAQTAQTVRTARVNGGNAAAPYKNKVLSGVDLSKALDKKEYKEKLDRLQKKIERLHSELYQLKIPVVMEFEGWDAGGKGGAIKRLTSHLDPRGYAVYPTAAPNDIEKLHHYLWRFWNNMPKAGHIAIFDRTWYGRVMVERIEGFCSEEEWKRAYQEINEMEEHITNFGAVVLKFWLHIDRDEQERRFRERMETPSKQWKITDEDWRNRAKWDEYEAAVDEMLVRTSTTYAPWIIVEANSKYYARVKVLQTVVDALEKRIEEVKGKKK